jgi:hypothetical protein
MQDKSISVRKLYEKFEAKEDLTALGEVTVEGWVRTNRNNGKIGFIALHDGTCFKNVQVVYENTPDFDAISHYPLSAAIEVKGHIVMTPGCNSPSRFTKLPSRFWAALLMIILCTEETLDFRISPRRSLSPSADQHLRCPLSGSLGFGDGGSYLLPGQWLRLCPYARNHRERCRRGRPSLHRDDRCQRSDQ